MPDQFGNQHKFPNRGWVGPRGQNAFLGVQTTNFTGLTGGVGTSYGIPGMTATRVGTGHYQFNHPVAKDLRFWPTITAPSGVAYNVAMVNRNVGTGNTQFYVRAQGTGGVFTGSQADNVNPMDGTYVDVQVFVAPTAAY